jgi:hypothetical protein
MNGNEFENGNVTWSFPMQRVNVHKSSCYQTAMKKMNGNGCGTETDSKI